MLKVPTSVYTGEATVSASQNPTIKSDDYPSSSTDSMCGSFVSTDSLDQFCRDFDSSVNTTNGDTSLENVTLHVCQNEDPTQQEINELGAMDPRFRVNSSASSESDSGRPSFKREKSQYEGMCLWQLPLPHPAPPSDRQFCHAQIAGQCQN